MLLVYAYLVSEGTKNRVTNLETWEERRNIAFLLSQIKHRACIHIFCAVHAVNLLKLEYQFSLVTKLSLLACHWKLEMERFRLNSSFKKIIKSTIYMKYSTKNIESPKWNSYFKYIFYYQENKKNNYFIFFRSLCALINFK